MSQLATDRIANWLDHLFDELVDFADYHDGPLWKEADETEIDKLVFGAVEQDGEQLEYALQELAKMLGFAESSEDAPFPDNPALNLMPFDFSRAETKLAKELSETRTGTTRPPKIRIEVRSGVADYEILSGDIEVEFHDYDVEDEWEDDDDSED